LAMLATAGVGRADKRLLSADRSPQAGRAVNIRGTLSSPFPTRALRGLAGAAVLFALLEAVTRAHIVDPTYLPPASSVLATTATLLTDPGFLAQVGATLAAWAVGLLSAVAIGVPLGILLGSSARWYAASITAIEFVRPVPSVALIPLAILLLGQDLDMKAALVAFASLWPVFTRSCAVRWRRSCNDSISGRSGPRLLQMGVIRPGLAMAPRT